MTRVLIVDDDVVCCESVSALLGMEGFEMRTSTDGAQSIEIAKEFQPNVLIVDLMLCGELDGIQVAKAIKQFNPSMQTIVVSGYASPNLQGKLEGDPSMRWVCKPARPLELIEMVREAVIVNATKVITCRNTNPGPATNSDGERKLS